MGRRQRRVWALLATGTYTGDGAATQAIAGVGFQPRGIIIYIQQHGALIDCFIKTDQDGLNTKYSDSGAAFWGYAPNLIISLDADGFTVGNGLGNLMNNVLWTYTFKCWG